MFWNEPVARQARISWKLTRNDQSISDTRPARIHTNWMVAPCYRSDENIRLPEGIISMLNTRVHSCLVQSPSGHIPSCCSFVGGFSAVVMQRGSLPWWASSDWDEDTHTLLLPWSMFNFTSPKAAGWRRKGRRRTFWKARNTAILLCIPRSPRQVSWRGQADAPPLLPPRYNFAWPQASSNCVGRFDVAPSSRCLLSGEQELHWSRPRFFPFWCHWNRLGIWDSVGVFMDDFAPKRVSNFCIYRWLLCRCGNRVCLMTSVIF